MPILTLSLAIGLVVGLRSMLGPAVVSWAAYLGILPLADTSLSFVSSPISVAVFSLLAVGELIADKLPFIPSRTEPGPLVVRILSGGFCAVCLALSARQSVAIPAVAGAIGAVVAAFAGYRIRKHLVMRRGWRDFLVALPEDLIALALACFIVSR